MPPNMASEDDHDYDEKATKGKSRRELPAGAVATLKAWLLSPEHFTHPYPTPQDQLMLMQKTGIDKKQLKNWFTNARRRIWKPMLKKQLEQGKLATTGAGGGVSVAGVVPGLMAPMPLSAQDGEAGEGADYQTQQQQYDSFGNPLFPQPQTQTTVTGAHQSFGTQYYQQEAGVPMSTSGSIGSLAPISSNPASFSGMMSKHDSHAVLMELFQRDQDLVRQASETNNRPGKAEGLKFGSSSLLTSVPSLSSWPHFSSITSLNNLGSMTGVKSITSLSGADLASQGNLSKSGNLAQVKSLESMGKHDSYAFLEVFFGDRGSSSNLNAKDQDQGGRGVKREREEDNDVGLSLDADESPSTGTTMKHTVNDEPATSVGTPQPAPLTTVAKEPESGVLKRAYDDAMAARGLISVSRSSERLTDLALPAKIQRTLSQEFLRQQQQTQYNQYSYTAPAPVASKSFAQASDSQQYPGQQPTQESSTNNSATPASVSQPAMNADPSAINASVEVPNATKCDLCHSTGVDTQLNPCGHYFHHRCLKPSLQTPMGQPKCPIDNIPIQSALLAIPAEEKSNGQPSNIQTQQSTTTTWANASTPVTAIAAESSVHKV